MMDDVESTFESPKIQCIEVPSHEVTEIYVRKLSLKPDEFSLISKMDV